MKSTSSLVHLPFLIVRDVRVVTVVASQRKSGLYLELTRKRRKKNLRLGMKSHAKKESVVYKKESAPKKRAKKRQVIHIVVQIGLSH